MTQPNPTEVNMSRFPFDAGDRVVCVDNCGIAVEGEDHTIHAVTHEGQTLYQWVLVGTAGGSLEWMPADAFHAR